MSYISSNSTVLFNFIFYVTETDYFSDTSMWIDQAKPVSPYDIIISQN